MDASSDHRIARIFVDEALGCGRAAGLDMDAMLSDLGIAKGRLDALNSHDFGRIWLELSFRMEDELFGLAKRPMRPGSTTLMGHAVRGAPTLEVGVRRVARFMRIVMEEPYGVVTRDGDRCVISLVENGPPRSAFTYRSFFLIMHGFTCWLAQDRVPLQTVQFPCPEPAERNDYGDFFGVPVQFDAPQAQLTFAWRYMTRPVNRSEKDLKRFLRASPETFLRGYRDTETLQHQIIKRCLSGPAQDWPDMAQAAQIMKMSRSTLHRRLLATGKSYGMIKEELRRDRAAELLKKDDRPVAAIVADLGYAEESAFYRAFQRWFGETPSGYRRAALNHAG